jgi:hypothetical protein
MGLGMMGFLLAKRRVHGRRGLAEAPVDLDLSERSI